MKSTEKEKSSTYPTSPFSVLIGTLKAEKFECSDICIFLSSLLFLVLLKFRMNNL